MDKVFNLETEIKTITKADDDSLIIEGYASTSTSDRDGDIILPSAWTEQGGLDNFKNNPILLFNHNRSEPVGSANELTIDSVGLKIKAKISTAAEKVHKLVLDGILKTFSVGFRVTDADFIEDTGGLLIKAAELLEVSVVSIPANQDAIFSVSKSFDNESEYEDFKKQLKGDSVKAAADTQREEDGSSSEEKTMEIDYETIAQTVAKAVATENAKAKEEADMYLEQVRKLTASNEKLQTTLTTLNERMEDVNLSNARLLYTNRVLKSNSLNERQRTRIVESISTAGSVEEAKVIYETLQSAVGGTKRAPQSLSEAVDRSSPTLPRNNSRTNKQQSAQNPQYNRMRALAGIKGDN